jgi:hypothetical protein
VTRDQRAIPAQQETQVQQELKDPLATKELQAILVQRVIKGQPEIKVLQVIQDQLAIKALLVNQALLEPLETGDQQVIKVQLALPDQRAQLETKDQ